VHLFSPPPAKEHPKKDPSFLLQPRSLPPCDIALDMF
jgi:hypothetical protein